MFSRIVEVVDGADSSTVVDALGAVSPSALEEDVMTGGEKLRQEGHRRALLRQLRRKFGPLPPDAEARVAAADEPTLDLWTDRVLTATRLDEVWGWRAAPAQPD